MPNLLPAYLLSCAQALRFGLGVWVLYYLRVTDYAGIGLVEALMMVTAAIVEVPTGALADRLGRRPTLALAFANLTIGYYLLSIVRDLPTLALSLVVITLGRSLYSGTLEALLYESLDDAGQAQGYAAALSRAQSLALVSHALATSIGGFLYAVRPELPFQITAAVQALGVAVALLVREPRRRSSIAQGSVIRLTVSGIRDALFSTTARSLVWPFLLVGFFAVVLDEILDDVLAVEFGFSPEALGLLFAVIYLTAAAAARLSPRLIARYRHRRLALGIGYLTAVSLLPAAYLDRWLGGATIVLRYSLRSILDTAASDAVQRTADSRHRATVHSTYVLIRSLPYIIGAYGIGKMMDLLTAIGFAPGLGMGLLLTVTVYSVFAARRRDEESDGP